MLKSKASSRRAQRLRSHPYSHKSTSTKAHVQFDRLGQQLKKKLRHGNAVDIIDSVKTEIGWVGLCILFLCIVSVCYIIIVIIYSGNSEETPVNLQRMHNKLHPDHISNPNDINSHLNNDGSSIEHALNIDPEHWPHHLSKDQLNKNKNDEINLQKRNRPPRNDIRNRRRRDREQREQRRDDQRDPREERREQRGERREQRDQRDEHRQQREERREQRGEQTNTKLKESQPDSESNTDSNWNKIWNIISSMNVNNSNINVSIFSEEELEEKAYTIKSAFLYAWHGYSKYALGHDEIQPVSDLPGDSWGGLGATLIDALDTMMLMGIKDEYTQAHEKLSQIHFDIDLQVSFFETIIRHLGGLISTYELSVILSPPDEMVFKQMISLADHLLPAFNTEKGIPKSMVNLKTKEIKNYAWTKDRSILSEIGSNQLEFTMLSKYTNDSKYYTKSINVFKLLDIAQRDNFGQTNGLFPQLINTNDATFPKNEKVYSLGGMSDSFYETTLKQWILTNYNDKLSIKLYMQSITAANEKLLRVVFDKNRREEPYFFYGEQWYSKFKGKMEELECFMPGVLALGAYHANRIENTYDLNELTEYEKQLINEKDKHLKLAHVLMDSCYSLYSEMPTGLAPESIEFKDDSWNAKEMKYQLRPETLESLYILYVITGNEQYRIWAWNIFQSIDKYCKTDAAFSGLNDVSEIPPKQDNQMQSYVMAETFKYLFLMFDTYARDSLPLDKYVFNTEAHPMQIIKDIEKLEWYSPVQ